MPLAGIFMCQAGCLLAQHPEEKQSAKVVNEKERVRSLTVRIWSEFSVPTNLHTSLAVAFPHPQQ